MLYLGSGTCFSLWGNPNGYLASLWFKLLNFICSKYFNMDIWGLHHRRELWSRTHHGTLPEAWSLVHHHSFILMIQGLVGRSKKSLAHFTQVHSIPSLLACLISEFSVISLFSSHLLHSWSFCDINGQSSGSFLLNSGEARESRILNTKSLELKFSSVTS